MVRDAIGLLLLSIALFDAACAARGGPNAVTLSCPSPVPPASSSPPTDPSSSVNGGPSFNFVHPWNSDPVSLAEAQASVSFPVTVPPSLGVPTDVYVEPGDLAIALGYEADCGRVLITEQPAEFDVDQFSQSIRALAAEQPASEPGDFRVETIGNTDALVVLGAGDHSVSVEWVQDGNDFQILVPDGAENQGLSLAQAVYSDVAGGAIPTLPTGVRTP